MWARCAGGAPTAFYVLEGTTQLGRYAAEALLTSAVVQAAAPKAPVWLVPGLPAGANTTAPSVVVDPAPYVVGLTPRVNVLRKPLNKGELKSTDVVLYCCTSFSLSHLTTLLSKCAPTATRASGGEMNNRTVVGPRIVVLSAVATQPSVLSSLQSLLNHCVSWVQVQSFGPPSVRLATAPVAPSALVGPLEHLCLGVSLGVTRYLAMPASTAADVVPVDVALETALAAMALMEDGVIPAVRWTEAPGSRPAGSKAAVAPPQAAAASSAAPSTPALHYRCNLLSTVDTGLVWGMVGEFMLDYYGRFAPQIGTSFPIRNFVDADPTIAFSAHLPDVWNYGINLTAPIDAYRRRLSKNQKTYLERFPYSSTVERLRDALYHIDVNNAAITGISPAARTTFDNGTYLMLLRKLSTMREYIDVFFRASLEHVYWDLYVKRVSVGVLHHLATHVLFHASPLMLPTPLPFFHNDLHFGGDERAPEANFPLRRGLRDVFSMVRGGQQPNGALITLQPGGTPQRFRAILAQPHIERLVSQLAKEQNVAREVVEQRGLNVLRGIGDTMNHQQLRFLAYLCRKVMVQVFSGINLNPEAFSRLWRALKSPRTAVVVIPSHRSYLDFIVVSYLLLVMGLQLPHICAGEDFLGLGQLAEFLRGSGAFFMRRSFKNDPLYAALFREYVRGMVRSGQNLEFFIEGTRSRSGKTLPPKMGILKFITDAFLEPQDEIDDVFVIPFSLTYERLLEANVYADELMGIPKPPETMGNLIKASSVLSDNYGSLNVHVSEPVSLKQFFATQQQLQQLAMTTTAPVAAAVSPPPMPPSAVPTASGKLTASVPVAVATSSTAPSAVAPMPPPKAKAESFTPNAALELLGWDITRRLDAHLVVTPTALLSAVVLALHANDEKVATEGVPTATAATSVEWLRAAVARRGAALHSTYAAFDGRQLVMRAAPWLAPALRLTPLQRLVLDSGVTRNAYMLLSMYTNQLIHLFADEGVLCIAALQQHAGGHHSPTSHHHHHAAVGSDGDSNGASNGGGGAPATLAQPQLPTPSDLAPPVSSAAAATAAAEEFPVDSARLAAKVVYLKRLLDLEFPNFLPTNPQPFDGWLRTALDKLLNDAVIVRPVGIRNGLSNPATPIPKLLLFRKGTLLRLCSQLIYPFVDSYFMVLLASTVLVTEQRVSEAALINTAHRALHSFAKDNRTLFIYEQSCSKETLKNAVAKFVESGVLAFDRRAPALSVVLRPSYAKENGAALMDEVRRLNAVRSPRPLTERELSTTVERVKAIHATAPVEVPGKKKQKAKL